MHNNSAGDDSMGDQFGTRSAVRQGYRKLGNEINDHAEELKAPDPGYLRSALAETDRLFQHVRDNEEAAPEAVLDANVMHSMATLARKNVHLIQAAFQSFNPVDYGNKLAVFMHGGQPMEGNDVTEDCWDKLAKCVLPHVRRAPIFHPMYGTFEVKEVEKPKRNPNPRKPRQAEENVKATQPENVNSAEKSQNELTEEEVQRVYTIIKKTFERNRRDPISYFELVLNPTSFSQTVENIFHLSFLAKDNLIKISLDEDGLPIVMPLGLSGKQASGAEHKNQFVMQITMDDWEDLVQSYDISVPLIPPSSRG